MPRDHFNEPSEKPFGYVALSKPKATSRPPAHESLSASLSTGYIDGYITALTPVQVASGTLELGEHLNIKGTAIPQLVKDAVRTKGSIYLPGSTLKGCIRSVVETITASCVCKTASRDVPQEYRECKVGKDAPTLCPACRIFGAMGYASRVTFNDAVQLEGATAIQKLPSLYQPRGSSVTKGRKFYFHQEKQSSGFTPVEMCTVGSTFNFIIRFTNLSDEELGILIIALGSGSDSFDLKLGAGKPVGYGSVKFVIKELNLTPEPLQRYTSWDAPNESTLIGDQLDKKVKDLSAKAAPLVVQAQYTNFLNLIRRRESPPAGLY